MVWNCNYAQDRWRRSATERRPSSRLPVIFEHSRWTNRDIGKGYARDFQKWQKQPTSHQYRNGAFSES